MALDAGGDKEAAGVRPGDDLVLAPPPEQGRCRIAHFLKETIVVLFVIPPQA